MDQIIDQADMERYKIEGFISPIRVLSVAEVESYADQYMAFSNRNSVDFDANGILRRKPHLVFPWLYDLVVSPAITDVVSAILGPNLLAWLSGFFVKRAG